MHFDEDKELFKFLNSYVSLKADSGEVDCTSGTNHYICPLTSAFSSAIFEAKD
jgi:hypothetical protein